MARAKIEPPIAGVLVRRVGVASSAIKNSVANAAGHWRRPEIDKSTLGSNANGYVAVYPSNVVLYRTAGLFPKPVPEVIRERSRDSIRTINVHVAGVAGVLTITFDDDTDWAVEFARGEHKHVRAVVDALSPPQGPAAGA